jgi:RNA polymerase sigma-70 factor, ECF subfamily
VDPKDEELIKLSREGDQEAFGRLVERYQKKVLAVAYGLIHDPDEAQDLTQETFIRAYHALENYRGTARFYTWLYRITVNLCMDRFRRRALERAHAVTEEGIEKNSPAPDDVAIQRESNLAIRQAILSLPQDQRAVIILREIEGLSYKEIAQTMDVSIGTVMSRLYYARRRLREILKP